MPKHYWKMIADEIHTAGWSYGFCTAVDPEHELLHYAWADKETGHRFTAQAETKMTAFIELQAMCSKHEVERARRHSRNSLRITNSPEP